MLVETLLAPLIALAAPAPAAFECDRLVAVGALGEAERPCAAAEAPGDLPSLIRARAADLADRSTAGAGTNAINALRDAARARRAAPDRVVEEALLQHLARVARATVPLTERPDLAQWPLTGMPVPAPRLPAVSDPQLAELDASIERSDERIRETEARLAGLDPRFSTLPPAARKGLGDALQRLQTERERLVAQRLAALEARTKTRRPDPVDLLHLADTYFAVDAGLPTPSGRRKRGEAVLRRLRGRSHRGTTAANIAAIWLAGFAVDEGDVRKARPLLDEAGVFDPSLSTFLEALLDWRRGEAANAAQRLDSLGDDLSPALIAHVAALRGTLALERGDPAAALTAWLRAAETAPTEQARRARLNAAIARAALIVAADDPATVARKTRPDLHRDVFLHLVSRGQLDGAIAAFDAIETAGRPADLPHLGLILVDTLRAADRAAAADTLLGRLVELCVAEGLWRKTHQGEIAATARNRLLGRVERRINQLTTTDVPLRPAARQTVEALVRARLTEFQLAEPATLELAAALARLGFLEAAEPPLARLASEARDPTQRRQAAAALLDARIQRAREAGAAGAPTGPWLLGAPITDPHPTIVTRVLEAQSRLIGYLPLGSAERDGLVVDRATIRIGTGDTGGIVAELRGVADRHLDTALGLRAIYQMMRARPDQTAALAEQYSRKNAGPAARSRVLETTRKAAYPGADPGAAAMNAGRYVDAAQTYAARADAAAGADAAAPRLAAAVAWTTALRPVEAEAAWRRFLRDHPRHDQAPVAHILLARLLQTQGRLAEAAAAYRTSAARGGPDAARALTRALRLVAGDFGLMQSTLEQLVRTQPNHPEAARFQAAYDALKDGHAPSDRPAGIPPIPPAPAGACSGDACKTATFWRETR